MARTSSRAAGGCYTEPTEFGAVSIQTAQLEEAILSYLCEDTDETPVYYLQRKNWRCVGPWSRSENGSSLSFRRPAEPTRKDFGKADFVFVCDGGASRTAKTLLPGSKWVFYGGGARIPWRPYRPLPLFTDESHIPRWNRIPKIGEEPTGTSPCEALIEKPRRDPSRPQIYYGMGIIVDAARVLYGGPLQSARGGRSSPAHDRAFYTKATVPPRESGATQNPIQNRYRGFATKTAGNYYIGVSISKQEYDAVREAERDTAQMAASSLRQVDLDREAAARNSNRGLNPRSIRWKVKEMLKPQLLGALTRVAHRRGKEANLTGKVQVLKERLRREWSDYIENANAIAHAPNTGWEGVAKSALPRELTKAEYKSIKKLPLNRLALMPRSIRSTVFNALLFFRMVPNDAGSNLPCDILVGEIEGQPDGDGLPCTKIFVFETKMQYRDPPAATVRIPSKGLNTMWVALVGDAAFGAHFFSAQGVNSGFREAAEIARMMRSQNTKQQMTQEYTQFVKKEREERWKKYSSLVPRFDVLEHWASFARRKEQGGGSRRSRKRLPVEIAEQHGFLNASTLKDQELVYMLGLRRMCGQKPSSVELGGSPRPIQTQIRQGARASWAGAVSSAFSPQARYRGK